MKTKLLFTSLLPVIVSLAVYAQNTWTRKADYGGTGRSSAAGFSIGDKAYVGTGYSSGEKKDFWEFDPGSDVWTQKADFAGTARDGAVGFSIGAKGYIGTGYDGNLTSDFWEYNPLTNSWTQKAVFPGAARAWSAGFSIGAKGYICSGWIGYPEYYTKDCWEYEPSTDAWLQKNDFGGNGREGAASFSIGNKGYMGIDDNGLRDFWQYDPVTDTWTRKADYAGTTANGGAGFNIGSKGYICSSDGGDNDFWEYDPATDTWKLMANFPGVERFGPVGFSVGSKGYFGLGQNKKDFWEYTPEIAVAGPPVITGFAPLSGPIGTIVTITGNHFGASPADNIVFFGATRATIATASETQIVVEVPAGATYTPITVTTGGLTAYASIPFLTTFPDGGVINKSSFAPPVNFDKGNYPEHIAIGDIDGDGRADIVVSSYGTEPDPTNRVSIYRNTSQVGAISFAPKIDILPGGGARILLLTDFDGDGKLDLGVRDLHTGMMYFLRNNSNPGKIAFVDLISLSTAGKAWGFSAGDIDLDGKTDIILTYDAESVFRIFRNTSQLGAIEFDAPQTFALPRRAIATKIADIDLDGKPEVVVNYYFEYAKYISVFRNTSTPASFSFDPPVNLTDPLIYQVSGIGIGDLDADGLPDLALSNFVDVGSGSITLFKNKGSTGTISFAAPQRFVAGARGLNDLSISDMDGDNQPDLVCGNYWSNFISVFKNNGKLAFGPEVTFASGNGTRSITLGDIDADGKCDIVNLNIFDRNLSVYRNLNGSTGCLSPYNLAVGVITATTAGIRWERPQPLAPSYKIRYNIAGSPIVLKRLVKGTATAITLHDLQPNTSYEWKMRSACDEDKTYWIKGPSFTTAGVVTATAIVADNLQTVTPGQLIVSPNPAKGQVQVQLQLADKPAPATFYLYNNQGTKVWQQYYGAISGHVRQSIHLPATVLPGMYMLVVEWSGNRYTQKLVVQ